MKIALVFTENMSLGVWHAGGLVRRDSLLYEKLIEAGHEVVFVTYGAADDADYLPKGSKIEVVTRPAGMGWREYSWNLHRLPAVQSADLIKSHQVNGARFAAAAALRLGKPYVARCGYLPSYFLAQERAPLRRRLRNWGEEFFSFHAAHTICLPSQSEIRYLRRRYGVNIRKARVCPNWVDTDFFSPDPSQKNPRLVCFVGRFEAQKDPLLVVEALRDLPDVELLMIGGGRLRAQLEAKIRAYGIRARVLDRVSNDDLPAHYRRAALYLFPTRYEGGSPKTLFEAMACGVPVVSTDGFGVDDAFVDGLHGVKVRVGDVAGLRAGVQKLLDTPELAAQMGAQARQHVVENYGIDQALARELAILAAFS